MGELVSAALVSGLNDENAKLLHLFLSFKPQALKQLKLGTLAPLFIDISHIKTNLHSTVCKDFVSVQNTYPVCKN